MKIRKLVLSGQMLVEVVVALGIIGLVMVGVSDLMTRSSRTVSFQKQKDEALAIAQDLLNDYRQERDTDPITFSNSVTGGVIDPCIEGKSYLCRVVVEDMVDAIMVLVKVEWNDGGQTYYVNLAQSLSKQLK